MTKYTFLVLLIFLCIKVSAQFDEQEFFNRIKKNYYALELTDLNNFSSWVTSNAFEEASKKIYDEEIYPLELIWVSPNDSYFIRRPIPTISDTAALAKIMEAQSSLQEELKALLIDWSRFYAGRILASMPPDYRLELKEDTVYLSFKDPNEPQLDEVRLLFGRNGLIIQTSLVYSDSSKEILTYPEFKYTGEYWLCTGWRIQIWERGTVSSGFQVKVISDRIGKYWIPSQFQMTLQSQNIRDKLFIRVYNFRNIRINRDIQVLNRGN